VCPNLFVILSIFWCIGCFSFVRSFLLSFFLAFVWMMRRLRPPAVKYWSSYFCINLSTCCSCHLYSAFLQFVCRCSRSANMLLLKSCCLLLWENCNKFFFFLNHHCSFLVSLSGFFERALFQFFFCLLFLWSLVPRLFVCLFVRSSFFCCFLSLCLEGFVEAWDGSSFFLFFSRADCPWRTSSGSEYYYGALFLSVQTVCSGTAKKMISKKRRRM